MLVLGLFSLMFCIVYGSENRLKVNIRPYGDFFYYLIYRDKISNLEGNIFEKVFTI